MDSIDVALPETVTSVNITVTKFYDYNYHHQEGGDVDSEGKLVKVDVFGDLCKGLDLGDKVGCNDTTTTIFFVRLVSG